MRILAGIEGISIIKFDERDIVRHKLVKRIVKAYDNEENAPIPMKGQDPPTPL
jgi:phosphate starvation-inducible PhoH-like protein